MLVLAALPAFCGVKVGDVAPPLHLQRLIPDQPVDTSLDALKGKAVVLEFWATHCGPCVEAIPHLNELVDQFAGRIQFVSVTAEDPPLAQLPRAKSHKSAISRTAVHASHVFSIRHLRPSRIVTNSCLSISPHLTSI